MFVWLAFLAAAGLNACSSSMTDGKTAAGGSAGQAGSATGGAAGTTAQAGATTQGGGGAAGTAPQGGGAGTGSDPCATALFCDDFEAYATGSPPGAPWSSNMSGGTVAVDTTHVHSGAHAVKMTGAATTTGYRSAMINLQNTAFLPTAGNVVYGRMMFWLDSAPSTSVHWTFIDGQGKVPGQNYHALYRYGGQLPISNGADFLGSQLMANYDTPDSYATPAVGPSSDCWLHSDMKVVPVATWACAEWKFDGAANAMQFWLNGEEITSLAMTTTGQGCVNQPAAFPWSAPTFDRIDLGWESYQADDARTIWIDDVAIGTKQLGCPQ